MSSKNDFIIDRGVLAEYTGAGGDVRVPAGVTKIAAGAFRDRKQLLSRVELPDTLAELPGRLFENCRNLTEAVFLGESTSIGECAFAGCARLQKVILPSALTVLPRRVFADCGRLQALRVPETVERIEDGAFRGCALLEGITLPELLTSLGSAKPARSDEAGVFEESGLLEIVIPGGVQTVGACAFKNCLRLASVGIDEGVAQIGARAFEGCRRLERVSVPDSLERIGAAAFAGCPHPERIALPGTLEPSRLEASLGHDGEYDGCVVKDGVMTAYSWTSSHVRIPDGVVEIADGVFDTLIADLKRNPRPLSINLPAELQKWNWPFPTAQIDCSVTAPEGFLRRTSPLPASLVRELIDAGLLKVSLADAVSMFCFQPRELSRIAERALQKDLPRALPALFAQLRKKRTLRALLRTADFLCAGAERVPAPALASFYQLFLKARAPLPAMKTAAVIFRDDPETCAETMCADLYEKDYADAVLASADIPADSPRLAEVRYARSERTASPHVVKCLLLPYLLPPKCLEGSEPGTAPELRISGESRELERYLRQEDLSRLVAELFPLDQLEARSHWMAPFCRFAGELDISRFNQLVRFSYLPGSHAAEQARYALTLSDTREAMCCSFEHNYGGNASFLHYYCRLRGMDVPPVDGDLRLHTDADGKKTWEVEGKRLTLRFCDDLRFRWETSGAVADGLQGFGLSAAAAAAMERERAIKQARADEVISRDKRALESAFLKATTISPAAFRRAYMDDSLRRRLARGIIWTQSGQTFTVASQQLVRSDGRPYSLARTCIRLAHPMEMPDAERKAWKTYLLRAGAAPIVDQLGERIQDPRTPMDRYNGCLISEEGRRIFEQTLGAIRSHPDRLQTPNNSFAISCREHPGGEGMLRLGSFYTNDFDRLANRALNILDNITIENRIARDDLSVLRLIDRFNFGPETRKHFLNKAIAAHASSLVAALLEQNRALNAPGEDFRLD